jgi:hypothetical protein
VPRELDRINRLECDNLHIPAFNGVGDALDEHGGHMKRLARIVAVTSLMMPLAFLASSSSANAAGGVQRYQSETLTITAWLSAANYHVYTVNLNPCDGTFSGSGSGFDIIASPYVSETITGSYVNSMLSLSSIYTSGSWGNPYSWTISPADTVSIDSPTTLTISTWTDPAQTVSAGQYSVVMTVHVQNSSSYRNHGDYVSANPGRDAAHSCIGMPIQSRS